MHLSVGVYKLHAAMVMVLGTRNFMIFDQRTAAMKIFKKALGSSNPSKDTTNTPKPPSKHPLSQQTIPPGSYGHFPPTFSIYFTGPSDDKKTGYFILGPESENENENSSNGHITLTPLNAITFYKRTAKHQLTLFAGPQHDTSPVLALAGIERYRGSAHLIALPGQEPGAGPGGVVGNRIVRLKYGGGDYFKYSFELEVGHDQHQHLESFEWRTSNAPRPQENKPFKRWLVRLGSNPDSPDREEEEIVGTWVKEQEHDTTKKKQTTTAKMGTFSFQGSAATGDLGPYCTLGIVVSLLRINQEDWMAAVAADIVTVSEGKVAVGVGAFSVTSAGLV